MNKESSEHLAYIGRRSMMQSMLDLQNYNSRRLWRVSHEEIPITIKSKDSIKKLGVILDSNLIT